MIHEPFTFRSRDSTLVYGHLFYSKKENPLFMEIPPGIHGGVIPNGKDIDPLQKAIAEFLIEEGFTVCFIDKRGSKGYGPHYMNLRDFCGRSVDDIIEGTIIALEKCKAQKTILHGTSSSATESLVAAINSPDLFTKIVLTSGFYNIPQQIDYEKDRTLKPTIDLVSHLTSEEIAQRNPLNSIFLASDSLSFLVIHGKDDLIVPVSQSERLVEELRRYQVDVDPLLYDSFPHTREASNPSNQSGKKYWNDLVSHVKQD